MDNTLLERLDAGGSEEREADARIRELEARLAEANARAEKAERDFKTLCRQTDQRDSEISGQFTLLDKARLEAEARLAEERRAVNDLAELLEEARSEAEAAEAHIDRLEAALNAVMAEEKFEMSQWSNDTRIKLIQAQPALAPDAAQPDCDHPFRVTGDVCLNCGAADAGK